MDYENASNFIINKVKTELPGNLYYHSYNHVMDVLQAATKLAEMENLNENDLILLKTAVLFHDSGFIKQNNDHEAIGCEIAKEVLPKFNYSTSQIESICGMIMATKIPQSPKNILEEIICDADLDYLGRDDFWIIGNHLFMELKMYGLIQNEIDWNKLQLNFLSRHNYFTQSAISLRQAKKTEHVEKIKKLTENQ